MRVYEYAKAEGMTNEEVQKKFGLPSHMSLVPEETTCTNPITEEKDADLKLIELSIRCCGSKSPYWSERHLIGRE